jgi:hypothetical protein
VKSLLGLLPENTPKSGIEGSADRALAESEQVNIRNYWIHKKIKKI